MTAQWIAYLMYRAAIEALLDYRKPKDFVRFNRCDSIAEGRERRRQRVAAQRKRPWSYA